jgi:uncharacterized protein
MELSLDRSDSRYHLSSFEGDSVTINGEKYSRSLILTPSLLIADWRPACFSDLQTNDLEKIIELQPEVLIIGGGEKQCFLPQTLMHKLLEKKIGCEVMTSSAACRTFALLCTENRNAALGLFF